MVQQLLRCGSQFIISLQTNLDKIIEILRHILWNSGQFIRNANLQNGFHCIIKMMLAPGVAGCFHLNETTAKGPYIGLASILALFDDLRGHPRNTALQHQLKLVRQTLG